MHLENTTADTNKIMPMEDVHRLSRSNRHVFFQTTMKLASFTLHLVSVVLYRPLVDTISAVRQSVNNALVCVCGRIFVLKHATGKNI